MEALAPAKCINAHNAFGTVSGVQDVLCGFYWLLLLELLGLQSLLLAAGLPNFLCPHLE